MTAQLAVRYEFSRDGDDFGWLEADLTTARVSGKAGFWVQWQDVQDWASELAAFPLRSDHRSEADWGQCETDGCNYQPIIKVVICSPPTGNLEVTVTLADHHDGRMQCQGIFRADALALRRFAQDLSAVINRELPQAVLAGMDAP